MAEKTQTKDYNHGDILKPLKLAWCVNTVILEDQIYKPDSKKVGTLYKLWVK